jgi:hypothetical protein
MQGLVIRKIVEKNRGKIKVRIDEDRRQRGIRRKTDRRTE